MEKMSLEALAREHLAKARADSAGRSAGTVYGGHAHVLRQTLIALTSGTVMDEHHTNGEATVYVLAGRVQLRAGADSWDGRAGDLIVVPRESHSVVALEDAAFLLTVALDR